MMKIHIGSLVFIKGKIRKLSSDRKVNVFNHSSNLDSSNFVSFSGIISMIQSYHAKNIQKLSR